MSHPNPQHDRSNEYPNDHYKPHVKKVVHTKSVADFHKSQMSTMMGLLKAHHNSKDRALKKRTG